MKAKFPFAFTSFRCFREKTATFGGGESKNATQHHEFQPIATGPESLPSFAFARNTLKINLEGVFAKAVKAKNNE